MGKHSSTARLRVRAAVAAGLVGVGTFAWVGIGHADGTKVVEGTPCTAAVRVCVDLASHTAWLIQDGAVLRGPVRISPGGPGTETPRGDFRVDWKDIDHHSAEFGDRPMPFSVFFAPGGIAFHEGSLDRPSAGCVRLAHDDAVAFFEFLAVDDAVQVH